MKLITLIDNYVEKASLYAEHGLSIFIDTGIVKILFDTGQSDNLIHNAEVLGIDLKDIDFVVLSHGHYDHTGGLYPFLQLNKKAKVICKKEIFIPKFNRNDKFIGLKYDDDLLEDRIDYIEVITEIADNIFIMPEIPISHPIDTHFNNLRVRKGERLVEDEMEDELFIVIKHTDKINILTACSHRGISNICKTATDFFYLPINLILGGFHLKECLWEQYHFVVDYLNRIHPSLIGTCHCTGIKMFTNMKRDINFPLFYNHTGNEIEL